MIIISNKPGQLCNLIIVYANFLALSFEHGIQIINPAFYAYKNYFTGSIVNHSGKRTFSVVNFLAKVLNRLRINNRLIASINIGADRKMLLDFAQNSKLKSKLLFVQGWQFRNNEMLQRNREKLLEYFTPQPEYQRKVTAFMRTIKSTDKIIVGVHIRRGDYEHFEDGKYFYSFQTYEKVIKKAAELFPENKVRFLICTNECEIEKKINSNGQDIVFGPGHELTDLYSFAQCDYLIGPPSTFTMWASFYGNVPLYMIKSSETLFSLPDFKVVNEF